MSGTFPSPTFSAITTPYGPTAALTIERALLGFSERDMEWSLFGSAFVFAVEASDCNDNRVPGTCDLRDGTSEDCNGNGIPDECDACEPGDFDFDGDVDLLDFSGFQRCFTGRGPVAVESCCTRFDGDAADGDLDQEGFVRFYRALGGP